MTTALQAGLAAANWWTAKAQIASILDGLIAFQNQVANPGAEIDTSNITATGPTIASSTEQALYGTHSLKATGSAAGTDMIEWMSSSVKCTVIGSTPYAWSVFAMPKAGDSVSGKMGIKWYTSGDVFISETQGATEALSGSASWRRLTLEATAPATAAFAVGNFREPAAGWATGKIAYFDGAMFNGGPLIAYIDGNQPGCAWDGGAGSEEIDTSNAMIKNVFTNPPLTIADQEWPCYIIHPPALTRIDRHGDWRLKFYDARLTCVVAEAEMEKAYAWIDSFREATLDAFQDAVLLNNAGTIISGPIFDEPGIIPGYAQPFRGFDAHLTIRMDDILAIGT